MREVTANKENYLQYVLDAAFSGTVCSSDHAVHDPCLLVKV